VKFADGFLGARLSAGKPTDAWGSLTLFLGLLSFLPALSPLVATAACLAGAVGTVLASRLPERFAGSRKIVAGLLLSATGMGLFLLEADLFLHFKIRQERDQRMAISRFRMGEIQEALERYRQAEGVYPNCSGAMTLCAALEPKYLVGCQPLDGFDRPFMVTSWREGYSLAFFPPPRVPGETPPPVTLENRFQPAPAREGPRWQGPPLPLGFVRPDTEPDAAKSGDPQERDAKTNPPPSG
jgi:hypothetical protein